jgi:hypothetical protein
MAGRTLKNYKNGGRDWLLDSMLIFCGWTIGEAVSSIRAGPELFPEIAH